MRILEAVRWCMRTAPNARGIVAISLLSLVDLVTFALPALIVSRVVNDAVAQVAVHKIAVDLAVLAAVGAVAAASGAARSYEVGRAAEVLALRLRERALRRLMSFPLPFYMQAPTGAMVSRALEATGEAAYGTFAAVSNGVDQVLRIVVALGVLTYLDWRLALISMLVIPLVYAPTRREAVRIGNASGEVVDAATGLYASATERLGLDAVLLARQMNRSEQELGTVVRHSKRQFTAAVERVRLQRRLTFAVGLGTQAAEIGVLAAAVLLVATGRASIGVVSGFAVLLAQLYGPLNVLSTTVAMVQTGVAATERLRLLLDDDDSRRPVAAIPATEESSSADLVVDAVSFAYPSRGEVIRRLALEDEEGEDRSAPVLKAVSFVVPAGSLTLVVGQSGAGKTTLVHALAGLLAPDEGRVLLGATDVRNLSDEERARRIVLVPQNAFLFRGTLRDNLAYARPDADESALLQAGQIAQLGALFDRLPDGLETVVGERGFAVSGGERQRIAIGRALLLDPDVLILDEPTAHLDEDAATQLVRAIRHARDGRTLIVVAHRFASIDADQTILIEHGTVGAVNGAVGSVAATARLDVKQ